MHKVISVEALAVTKFISGTPLKSFLFTSPLSNVNETVFMLKFLVIYFELNLLKKSFGWILKNRILKVRN